MLFFFRTARGIGPRAVLAYGLFRGVAIDTIAGRELSGFLAGSNLSANCFTIEDSGVVDNLTNCGVNPGSLGNTRNTFFDVVDGVGLLAGAALGFSQRDVACDNEAGANRLTFNILRAVDKDVFDDEVLTRARFVWHLGCFQPEHVVAVRQHGIVGVDVVDVGIKRIVINSGCVRNVRETKD